MAKGAISNKTGNQLEMAVKNVLSAKGFEVLSHRVWKNNPEKFGEELLLTHVPFETIYGHHGNTEFLLLSKKHNIQMRIECKWQQSSGSVDEKLPYLYLNAIEEMPEQTIMILIDGSGFKLGAIKWLRDAVTQKKYMAKNSQAKEILVVNLVEFFTWANRRFN